MSHTINKIEQQFLEHMYTMNAYEQALGLMEWDARTKIPEKGTDDRAEAVGRLSTELFQLTTSDKTAYYVDTILAYKEDEVTPWIRKAAEELKKQYERSVRIPSEEYQEYSTLAAKSEAVWEQAKEADDFEMLRPYLEKLVEFSRRFAEYWGYDKHPYDALLEDYEPGMTTEMLDDVFNRLHKRLQPLVDEVAASSVKPDTSILFEPFPKQKQTAVSSNILRRMTYDFAAGRLDETAHPFALGLNPSDVRVTTNYDENDFRTALFGTIHEGGHALYEQNLPQEWKATVLSDGASMGIHESQSLFWENVVGRSKAFWEYHYDMLREEAGSAFDDVTLDEFYRAINTAGPSLIRIEADELTYTLHIMLRYEIEKQLINGDIEVKDLPRIWNEKMQEYLGITPPDDSKGVLQDVHWSFGAFGYFPSYALGYMYAAQFYDALRRDIPDFDTKLQEGNLEPIKQWMTNHVHQYGKSKTPVEIIKEATGESINPDYLLDYLETKYRKLYSL
ncbi:carboxypeptidase M32 [Salibacterium halotolerans]|uniref:Metal-dependent carboxypeptidase n=1 Tax=Salibacterium halotolerans TaxID=1884432 RepID=A0A1I5URD2_9BACI|nr:carboxypeptidase M32 [Salibacterium halotolerans]SFP97831.1 carboxypeptidase Taq [Salibacterium halotolerans]